MRAPPVHARRRLCLAFSEPLKRLTPLVKRRLKRTAENGLHAPCAAPCSDYADPTDPSISTSARRKCIASRPSNDLGSHDPRSTLPGTLVKSGVPTARMASASTHLASSAASEHYFAEP